MTALIPDAKVALRYGVVLRTIDRWDRNVDLGFPAPVYINGRKYRRPDELDAWDRSRALAPQPSPAPRAPATVAGAA